MTPNFMDYEQWLSANGLEKHEVVCDECCGDGQIECLSCGHWGDCAECDGRGRWDETRDEYERQKTADQERLKKYQAEVGVGAPPGAPT